MIFMDTILENIEKGREVDDDKFVSLKVEEIRENLRNIINKEIAKQSEKNVRKENEKKKAEYETSIPKENERKEKSEDEGNDRNEDRRDSVIIESILNRISNQIDNTNLRTNNNSRNYNAPNSGLSRRDYNGRNNNGNDKRNETLNRGRRSRGLCKYFDKGGCRNGRNCRFEHPEICNEWYEHGRCKGVNGECEMAHPNICSKYIKREPCTYRDCLYMHPRGMKKANHREERNDTQRHSERKPNRGRTDNNFRSDNKFFHQEQYRGRQRIDRTTTERELQQRIEMLEEEVRAFRMVRRGSRVGYYI